MPIGFRIGAVLAIALMLALGGCGDESGERPPSGPLADALAAVGGGGPSGALGVGWAEPRLVERSGAGPELIADALGPNADTLIENAPLLRRRLGFDPLAAERLTSVGGSYAFGLRIDGVDGGGLAEALTRAGGRARQVGDLELVDIGDYAEMPEPLLRLGVDSGPGTPLAPIWQ